MDGKKKPKDGGPILSRDPFTNKLNEEDAQKVTRDLMRKLVEEERHFDKENSFNLARSGKRDIVVMMGVYIRNSVDGKMVIGDDESKGYERFSDRDMFKYRTVDMVTVEFGARNIPGTNEYIGKGLMSGFTFLCKRLMSIGGLRG